MSKFKVGDRVRNNSASSLWSNAPDVLVVKEVHSRDRISFEDNPLNGTSEYDATGLYVYPDYRFEWAERPKSQIMHISGTTYALTPYEEPKLVTIDGVVYAMTEVV